MRAMGKRLTALYSLRGHTAVGALTVLSIIIFCALTLPDPSRTVPGDVRSGSVQEVYGRLPLYFIQNEGQLGDSVKYYERGLGHSIFFSDNEILFQFAAGASQPFAGLQGDSRRPLRATHATEHGELPARISEVRMYPVLVREGVSIEGLEPQEGKVNYLIGNEPAKWKTNIPTYRSVVYREAYPGVDLKFYGSNERLEYDVIVSAGADPSQVKFAYSGVQRLSLSDDGDLHLQLPDGGTLVHKKPVAYQEINGERHEVEGAFAVEPFPGKGSTDGEDSFVFGFKLAAYNPGYPLVIDPVLVYSSYLGGSAGDNGHAIAVDSSGYAYVTGRTYSNTFPTSSPLDGSFGGGTDVFVTKLNLAGTALVYSTYLGGSDADSANAIAVDSSNCVYLTGETLSSNFPVSNPYLSTLHSEGYSDAFVAKLSATGAALTYSTYLGGSLYDAGLGIAVDNSGQAYVTGETSSSDFPIEGSALQSAFGGGTADAFLTILNASGNDATFSTYIGGYDADSGYGIAVNASHIYLAGETASANFPTTGGLQTIYGGGEFDAFVMKIARSTLAVVYATYLGGSGADYGRGIAVDSGGSPHVTGSTTSSDFPLTNAFQEIPGGGEDAFITKVAVDGNSLAFSSYLGGAGDDIGFAITVDSKSNAYVVGKTSGSFPTGRALQSVYGGGSSDAFVARIDCTEGEIAYSTYLGGSAVDVGHGIAVGSGGNVYVTGWTSSYNYPTTSGAFMVTKSGNYDGFVTKLNALLADFTATPTSGLYPLIVSFTDTSEGTVASRSWNFGDGFTSTAQNPVHTYSSSGTYTVSLAVTGPGGEDTKTRSAYIKVAVPEVTIAATIPKVSESGGGSGQFTVYRSAYTSVALTVNYTVNGTATGGTDYTALTNSVTIPAGASSAPINITPVWDHYNDGNETVIANIASSSTYTIGTASSATVTIVDHDLPAVSVSASVASVSEKSAQPGLFVVSRAGITTNPLTVYYSTGGTGTPGTDYTALSGSVIIPAGSPSATIAVAPLWDAVYDGDKTVILSLSANSLYSIASPSSATVTIVDSDLPIVTIAAAAPSIPESGSQAGQYIVTHTGTTALPLTVKYSVGGTAVSGTNFVPLTTTLTIPVGSSSAIITLTPIQDSQYTGDLTVMVSLTASSAYTIGTPSSAAITITESDLPKVTVTATQPNATEPSVAGQFTVSRTGITTSALTVNYGTTGTAVPNVNYTQLAGTVIIPAGLASATVSVQPLDDTSWTGPTTVVLTLTAGSYTVGTPGTATVTIADNDGPTITIAATRAIVAESDTGKGQFTVTRSAHIDAALTVAYTISGTATPGSDYVGLPLTMTIPAGYSSGTILVTPLEDFVSDGDKTVVVTLNSSVWYKVGSPGSATVTILDSDLPVVTIAATVPKVLEQGSQTAQFTVIRSMATTSPLTVTYTTGGTAIPGVDFTAPSGTVTIPAGASSAIVAVSPVWDHLYDGNQTLVLTLTGGSQYDVGSPSSASATIVDQDVPTVTITASIPTVSETASSFGQFTVTHSGVTALPVTVGYTVGGTATGGVDFTSLTNTVTIPAGSSSATIPVFPIEDSTADDAESVIVTLTASSLYALGSPSSATVTIYETGTPTLTIVATAPFATEGGAAGQFTVYRTKMATEALTVGYSVGGTATSGVHFAQLAGSVTLPAGATSANIAVQPVENSIQEGAKTVVLTLLPGQPYLVGSPDTATVTIADNDGPTVMIEVVKSVGYEAGQVPAQVKISRPSGSTAGDLPVAYELTGTATNHEDFELSGTVVIPSGSAYVILDITPIDDNLDEARETVYFTLVNNGWYQIGWPYTAIVYIGDNDPPMVTVVATDNSAEEANSSTGKFTITRQGLTTSSLIVYYTLGGTAVNGVTYVQIPSSVTISAGASTAEVVIAPIDDNLYTGNQTVTLTLTTTGVYNIGSPNSATITIYDNELPTVTASAPVAIVDENGTEPRVFRISRSGNSELSPALTVKFSLGGTATEGTDYEGPLPATVTIPAGAAYTDLQIVPIDDNFTNGSRTVVLTISSNSSYNKGSPGSATITIVDDESPKVSILATKDYAVETGSDTGKFTVFRTGDLSAELNVTYSVGGTAVPNKNYSALPSAILIPAFSSSADITVVPIDDNAVQVDRSVIVTLTGETAYYVGSPNQATVMIVDDEMPRVSISPLLNASEAGTVGQFKVSRFGNSHFDLLVNYATGGTATSGVNYAPLPMSVTIPGGQTSTTIDVTAIDDNQSTEDLTVAVSLLLGSGYTIGTPDNATIAIVNTDLPMVKIAASDSKAAETGPNTGSFTISRTGPTTATLAVKYNITGTAKNGTDYVTLSTSKTIPAGVSSAVITVTPILDNALEGNETVKLTLKTDPTYLIGKPSAAAVTIADAPVSSISGKVTVGGSALSGVTVALTGAATANTTTDSSGNYTFSGLLNGSYTITPTKDHHSFNPTNLSVSLNGTNVTGRNFAATFIGYSLSGTVTSGGTALTGVTVALTGTTPKSTTTDSSGNYAFTGLLNGACTITPSKDHYTFNPTTLSANVNGADVTGRNFTATFTGYSLSGKVTSDGVALSGVTIALSGAASKSTTTDSGGNYTFTGLLNGTYTMTPSKGIIPFSPTTLSVTINGVDVGGKNFTASTSGYSLSGTVTSGGSPVSGVTINITGATSRTTTTDSSGNYSFPFLANGTYTVTPSIAGLSFDPTSRNVSINGADVTERSFTCAVAAATLISPTGAISTSQPAYQWNAVAAAEYYLLAVYDSADSWPIIKWYSAAEAGCNSGAGTCSVTPSVSLRGGSCKWYIQTWNSKALGLWSTGMTFTVPLQTPKKATLVSPTGTLTKNKPTYTWNAVANAESYQLAVNDSTNTWPVLSWYSAAEAGCSSGTGTCSFTPDIALADGNSTWYILTKNAHGPGEWSDPLTFNITAVLPGQATQISPKSPISTNKPTYTWNAVADAKYYLLAVDDSSGSWPVNTEYTAAAVGCGSGTGTCTMTPNIALASGSCRWFIRTKNDNGYGPWSTGLNFVVSGN